MHHISVDSVELRCTWIDNSVSLYPFLFTPSNSCGIFTQKYGNCSRNRWVKISFLCFIISLFYYICVPIQLFIWVLVASSGYLPCSFTLSKYPLPTASTLGNSFWLFVFYFFTSVSNIQYLICYSPIFFAISFLVN